MNASHVVVIAIFLIGYLVFALNYISVTFTWRQRAPLLWALLPIALGMARVDSADMVLAGIGGALAIMSAAFHVPRGVARGYYRRKAEGEDIQWADLNVRMPPGFLWLLVLGVVAWVCASVVALS
ncbi:hypothetical protein [Actinoallomurus acaciae]|uniref:DUF1295 domain-containing protein n=1 Tax=Actinoallomurus acaciae TaxID=502577 RepID=A0ABV5YZ62_9ACTN